MDRSHVRNLPHHFLTGSLPVAHRRLDDDQLPGGSDAVKAHESATLQLPQTITQVGRGKLVARGDLLPDLLEGELAPPLQEGVLATDHLDGQLADVAVLPLELPGLHELLHLALGDLIAEERRDQHDDGEDDDDRVAPHEEDADHRTDSAEQQAEDDDGPDGNVDGEMPVRNALARVHDCSHGNAKSQPIGFAYASNRQ